MPLPSTTVPLTHCDTEAVKEGEALTLVHTVLLRLGALVVASPLEVTLWLRVRVTLMEVLRVRVTLMV